MNEPSPVKSESEPAGAYTVPVVIPPWLGWAAAFVCFFAAIFFAGKSFNIRGQLQSVLEAERVARLEAGTLKNLLEAERILSRAQLNRLTQAGLDRLVLIALAPPLDAPSSVQGVIAVNPSLREYALALSNLPHPPAGKVYQLWATSPASDPIHLGTLPLISGSNHARLSFATTSDARTFKITVEPEGPAPAAPQGPTLLATP